MKPVICLMGPTASGKSATTLALAQQWPVEVINVDSATIYRGMDIGTAKPSAAEQAQVPQHLLDILDPLDAYSADRFRREAGALIDAIHARGRIPLLAGGTMLYFMALRQGLDDLPPADPAVRAKLEAQAAALGWPAMHAELARVDPITAARLPPNDRQRIQRALEIHAIAGQPMSALLASGAGRAPVHADVHWIDVSLEPSERSALHARIAQRFDAMLAAGLMEEVAALHARGDLHPGLPSIRCVGYRQLWAVLDGETDLPTAREQAIAATRQLAKRQLTWLRGWGPRHTIDCLDPHATVQVVETVRQQLATLAAAP